MIHACGDCHAELVEARAMMYIIVNQSFKKPSMAAFGPPMRRAAGAVEARATDFELAITIKNDRTSLDRIGGLKPTANSLYLADYQCYIF